jgi:hypothetical protein
LILLLPWVYHKWKGKAPPDLTLCFETYEHPILKVLNPSDKPVERASLFVGLFDLDVDHSDEPVHASQRTLEFIDRHTVTPAYDVLGAEVARPLKDGDRIIGLASITCSLCADQKYFYVNIIWGKEGGWFSRVENPTTDQIPALRIPNTNEFKPHVLSKALALEVDKVPEDERIPIRNMVGLVEHGAVNEFKCAEK